jgi:hypothetical protein
MYKSLNDFISAHPIFAALPVSALWMIAGYQDHVRKKRTGGFLWWTVSAVVLLFAFGVHCILSGSWLSLVITATAILVEIWFIGKWYRREGLGHA